MIGMLDRLTGGQPQDIQDGGARSTGGKFKV
jgi:hypothetical protein